MKKPNEPRRDKRHKESLRKVDRVKNQHRLQARIARYIE